MVCCHLITPDWGRWLPGAGCGLTRKLPSPRPLPASLRRNLTPFVLILYQVHLNHLTKKALFFNQDGTWRLGPDQQGNTLSHPPPYLQGRPLLAGPLAGALSFQPQLHKQLQQVHEQLIHEVLVLDVGGDVGQGIDHRQGAVPGGEGDTTAATRPAGGPPLQPGGRLIPSSLTAPSQCL